MEKCLHSYYPISVWKPQTHWNFTLENFSNSRLQAYLDNDLCSIMQNLLTEVKKNLLCLDNVSNGVDIEFISMSNGKNSFNRQEKEYNTIQRESRISAIFIRIHPSFRSTTRFKFTLLKNLKIRNLGIRLNCNFCGC